MDSQESKDKGRRRQPINAPSGTPPGSTSAPPAPKPPPPPPPPPPEAPGTDGGEPAASSQRRRRRLGNWAKAALPAALAGAAIAALLFVFVIDTGKSGNAPAPTPSSGPPRGQDSAAAVAASDLGFPVFATKNTTRIGGEDATTNAAAAALAVYPSTGLETRPQAVTLVAEDDWAAAIAASVFAETRIRAPLLYSSAGSVPSSTSKALDALRPSGDGLTNGAQAIVVGDVSVPRGTRSLKVGVGDLPQTAAEIAQLHSSLVGSKPAIIIITTSEDAGFAMPAAAWAARSGDPVLFTGSKSLPDATATFLRGNGDASVYVLGPKSVIPAGIVKQIAKINPNVQRVSGNDPVSNSIEFARYTDGTFGWNINDPGHGLVIIRDAQPADAGAVASISASGTWGPLLLTDSATLLPTALRSYLLDIKPGYETDPTRALYNHVWVIGDQSAIDVSQQAEFDSLAELLQIGGEAEQVGDTSATPETTTVPGSGSTGSTGSTGTTGTTGPAQPKTDKEKQP